MVSIESMHKSKVQQGQTPTKGLEKIGDDGDGVVQQEVFMETLTIGTNVEDVNIVDVGGSSVGGQQIANNLLSLHGAMSNASMPLVLGQVSQPLKARLMPINLEPFLMSNVTFNWTNFLKFTHAGAKN